LQDAPVSLYNKNSSSPAFDDVLLVKQTPPAIVTSSILMAVELQ